MRLSELKRHNVNDSYFDLLESFVNDRELIVVSGAFDKLTGYLEEDAQRLSAISNAINEHAAALMEDSVNVDFDPYSHFGDTKKPDEEDGIDEMDDCVLTISGGTGGGGNEKMAKLGIVYFSLPAGYSCPYAGICKSIAHKRGGKFKDPNKPEKDWKGIKDYGDIRCYAANAENAYPSVRKSRWRNFDLLIEASKMGGAKGMATLIQKSLAFFSASNPPFRMFRIHDSGDFFSQDYLDAWVMVAAQNKGIIFYAYTKSLPYLEKYEGTKGLPSNFRIIASAGGKADHKIKELGLRQAIIVKDEGEAIEKMLNIDVNDFLAVLGDEGKDFALLLHGNQSAESGNTKQARANSALGKKVAKKFNVPPEAIAKLIAHYTS